jgi:hypothetical protein
MAKELREMYIEGGYALTKEYDAFKADMYALGITFIDLATTQLFSQDLLETKLDLIEHNYGVYGQGT